MKINIERFAPVPHRSVSLPEPVNQVLAEDISDTYFNHQTDQRQQEAYYQDLQLSSDKSKAFQQLHQRLMTTHTNQLDYNPRDYNWVHMSPELRLQPIYSGPEEKSAADGQLRFALPPVSARKLKRRPGAAEKALSKLTEQAKTVTRELANSPLDALQTALKIAEFEARRFFSMEHVVAQNWFDKHPTMRGDLHILFPERKDRNCFRGHLPLRDLPGPGDGRDPKNAFEPTGGKGAAARATLYFLVRYPHMLGGTGEITEADIEQLKKWSDEEPPGLYEFHRNAEIQKEQGNRNPFIDNPRWIHKVDFKSSLSS